MKLNFKFSNKARPAKRARVIDALTKYGIKRVEPLFEKESDPELGSMFFLECDDKKTLADAFKLLEEADEVEYAEEEPLRKLIR